jgi:glycosyltransferase involved in cell wall biosynthesis
MQSRLILRNEELVERVRELPPCHAFGGLVSIIIPFLNGARFFDETISGVVAQTHSNWEIVFVDDGSTDESTLKAAALSAANPGRIALLQHPGQLNRGQSASRNVALEHARGQYVAFLDIDDYWLPDKLSRQVSLLVQFPSAAMVYGPLVYWYGWTGRQEDMHRDFMSPHSDCHDVLIAPPQQVLHLITFREGLPAPSCCLIRRDILDQGIRFDESFGMYEDEAFLAQIALRFPVFLMSESFELYRQHPDSFTAQAQRSGEYVPGKPNPARAKLLHWLHRHIVDNKLDDGRLLSAIHLQFEAY